METIVFDGSTMRHSMSQCHCVSPVPTAVLGWMQVGQERKRLCFLNLEQQEAEGDWEVTGPAKVTHPPQPGAVWRAPRLSAVPPLWWQGPGDNCPFSLTLQIRAGHRGTPISHEEGQDEVPVSSSQGSCRSALRAQPLSRPDRAEPSQRAGVSWL